MLKKQTVWLLTMLSLVVVLSVYYVTAPKDMNDRVAFTDEQNQTNQTEKTASTKEEANVAVDEAEAKDEKVTSSATSDDDVFTALRLQIEDERSRQRDQLNTIVTSSNTTPEQKNDAYEKMQQLQTIANKEATLETLIKSKGGYEDVLVRADGDTVRVMVKAKQSSTKAANEIIQLVKSEMKDMQDIAVEFQPVK
ncbi:stage III sporulation protein AH [Anoxybacillus sp. B7M1]|uniref:SpoIIIAH-like family protein n=1 Tax=Anoxybacteroides rupiense TaxID=311460 RepID=A0ABD5ISC5_9BACL|nr:MULTISPECIES: SpoIIIAH-like family protein [Anoxybacillus]ANB58358.1 stage III sporulation protein AH [Anoxybacillus sp. B2M1]ANB64966.1 stage III sporulation protein AH [Anoxybacillus sp. B7M1]KXG11224.1 Stage III sporulation protein AH [Anoxybacillus sp. P3H1B]MBB3906802.1 stage III sporulation protein AH [Anoxybacillus rupiensis]MBS2770087.1 SpoIIIAH-like family protein [Anoxybacillus rupiensis]